MCTCTPAEGGTVSTGNVQGLAALDMPTEPIEWTKSHPCQGLVKNEKALVAGPVSVKVKVRARGKSMSKEKALIFPKLALQSNPFQLTSMKVEVQRARLPRGTVSTEYVPGPVALESKTCSGTRQSRRSSTATESKTKTVNCHLHACRGCTVSTA